MANSMFNIEPVTQRFVFVIGIIVVLMIPLLTVMVLSFERKGHYDNAVASVAQAWSGSQSFAGPLLLVETIVESSGDQAGRETKTHVFLPSELTLNHNSSHEMRNRGIYRIPVFSATVMANATFPPVDVDSLPGEIQSAAIALGITDSRGVRSAKIHWNGEELGKQSPSQLGGVGSIVRTELSQGDLLVGGSASVEVELRGTGRFSVLPVGDETTITMSSDWPHPSFDGRYLPDERDVTDHGFTASWTTHELSRGFPSQLDVRELDFALGAIRSQSSLRHPDLGYSILTLNTPYRAVERSIKYGVLFIVMTMVAILCIELVSNSRMHIVQYGVVGVGLVMFFLILLSLSEHIGFGPGYAIAAVLLASMNTVYVWFASKNKPVSIAMSSILIVLYVALYLVLQMNEYALLVGSILLLILLAALMYATRTLRAEDPIENG